MLALITPAYIVKITSAHTTHHRTCRHSTCINTTQHNTTQHNTTQHNTTQHNTTQYNIISMTVASITVQTYICIRQFTNTAYRRWHCEIRKTRFNTITSSKIRSKTITLQYVISASCATAVYFVLCCATCEIMWGCFYWSVH